jgi:hypothetical protein
MRSAAKLVLVLSVVAVALTAVGSGSAGGAGSSCGPRDVSQPFLPWLDPAHYFLLPGGDFESASSWSFTGGARVVAGNQPYRPAVSGHTRSLLLTAGASATSAPECVDGDEPTLRFFARNTGSILSALVVEARVRTTLQGVTTQTTVPLGVVLGTTRSWQPSLPVLFGLSANQLLGGTTTVDFRFVPVGIGGSWQIDDVYVDPFKDRAAA